MKEWEAVRECGRKRRKKIKEIRIDDKEDSRNEKVERVGLKGWRKERLWVVRGGVKKKKTFEGVGRRGKRRLFERVGGGMKEMKLLRGWGRSEWKKE